MLVAGDYAPRLWTRRQRRRDLAIAENAIDNPRAAERVLQRIIAVKPDDLAHTLAHALALPLLDLNAVDVQKLPRNLVDAKISSQYQLVVLGKRGNRLFIGAADPTDQEAVERIKDGTITSYVYDPKAARLVKAA